MDGDDIKITPVTVIYFVVNLTTSSDLIFWRSDTQCSVMIGTEPKRSTISLGVSLHTDKYGNNVVNRNWILT